MRSLQIVAPCGICGELVRSTVGVHWNPGKRALRAYEDMQAHLNTHSFAELLRFEIRQDLDQVPDDERAAIVRDIYRNLLGQQTENGYVLNQSDSEGVYSIDEVLGNLDVYRLWRSSNRCGEPGCAQH